MLVDVLLVEPLLIFFAVGSFSHYYAQSCLVVNDPILIVEFQIVPAVETTISKHVVKGKGL